MHKLHQKQVLPCSSLSHLQPSLHTRLHFASQLSASPVRWQPPLPFAPLANFNAATSAVHSSPDFLHPSNVYATSKQSPASDQHELSVYTPVLNWLPPASTSGSTPMQSSSSVTSSSTPKSWDSLMKMIKNQRGRKGEDSSSGWKPESTFSLCLCLKSEVVNV